MYPSVNKLSLTAIGLLTALAQSNLATAKEIASTGLGNTVGATDYYKVTCSDGTDHFQLSVIDQTPITPPAPQLLNVHLSKLDKPDLVTSALAIQSGAADQMLTLLGGSGKYKVIVDTEGTNIALTKAQTFKFTYQCLYADGTFTKLFKSGTASIKNGKLAKYTVNCPVKKKTRTKPAVDVDSLTFTLIDKTKTAVEQVSSIVLSAQATKEGFSTNTSDTNGDLKYSPVVNLRPTSTTTNNNPGDGDYYISVDNTGTQDNQDNKKQYAVQYSCLNQSNQETSTTDALVVQDQ
jgi:hypothetical protein